MRLSKSGYGSRLDIEQLSSDKFINLIHYENFLSDYKEAVNNLNKGQ